MLRSFSTVVLLTALAVSVYPELRAQSIPGAGHHVIAIVRLKHPAPQPADEAVQSFQADQILTTAGDRDEERARRDARVAARIASFSRADRDRVTWDIQSRGGRLMYSLNVMNAIVAD